MFSIKCKFRQHFYPNAVQTFDKLILAKNLRNCTKGESIFAFHHNLPAGLVSRPLSWSSYSLPRRLSRSTQFQFLPEEIRWDPCCKWNHYQVGHLTSFAIKVLKNRFLWSSKQYFQSSPKRNHKHTWSPLSHERKNKLFVIQLNHNCHDLFEDLHQLYEAHLKGIMYIVLPCIQPGNSLLTFSSSSAGLIQLPSLPWGGQKLKKSALNLEEPPDQRELLLCNIFWT